MRNTAFCLALIPTVLAAVGESADVDFNRDVRPILARRCFACHGPDEHARESELRLDSVDSATKLIDGHRAIQPGQPRQSELIARVTSSDPDLRMPPAPEHPPLAEKEVQILTQWIEAGAVYEAHWAFVPPQKPAVPAGAKHPIDAFIQKAWQEQHLTGNPAANPVTLVRRVSLDLTGLPPTPEEVDAFLTDCEQTSIDAAYARLVDRLLASPEYGVRWARPWLDLARYADTNGYEKDREREIWAYRDWVIQALNDDMPFDEFTRRQLAGDMLPKPSLEDLIATGFHRNTMLNEEGGIDPLEFRFYAMTDRVATTGTAWLGLTLGCVQCHSHKYDPVQHREYYEFMALLDNADELELDLPNAQQQEQFLKDQQQAVKLLEELPAHWPNPEGVTLSDAERADLVARKFDEWLTGKRQQFVQWQPLTPLSATSNLPLLTIQPDASILASGDTTKQDFYDISLQLPEGQFAAMRLEALPDDSLPAHGPGTTFYEGTRGDFFLGELQARSGDAALAFSAVTDSFNANRFGNNPTNAALTIDGDTQTGWSVHGRQGERHTAIFTFKEPLQGGKTLDLHMIFGRHFSSSLGRFRFSVTTSSSVPEAQDVTARVEELFLRPADMVSESERQELFHEFLLEAPELKKFSDPIYALRRPPQLSTTLIFRERPPENPRPTYIHRRGEYLQTTDQVQAGPLQALHAWPDNVPRNRLGLADWLMSLENPLTARVVVNRHWATLFGRGLVETTEDFGSQGASPSHPELLDWLAVEFREQGWSVKKLHRLMVMSEAYRQSAVVQPDQRQQDPQNIWLTRSARPRLEAEVIRDSVLRAAGLLSEKKGGPGVRPPQPAGVTETAYGSPSWNASEGEDRYRRSVYTFMKRTAPFAMFNTFDAPSGESCLARRERSDTPLQALTLLNDVMMMEASEALGKTLSTTAGSDADRVELAFRRILSRRPTPEESATLVEFVAQVRSHCKPEQAATIPWTSLARALFSLDEAIVRN